MNSFARKYEYPYNLISDVFNEEWDKLKVYENGVPADLDISVEYAVNSLGSEQEADILHAYYREKKTLTAIGEPYGIKYERVRQIISFALRKLRTPDRKCYFVYGIKCCIDKLKEEHEQALNEKDTIINKLSGENKVFTYKGERIENVLLVSIKELPLRAKAVVTRLGIVTLAELLEYTPQQLTEVKGCGTATVEKIINFLHDNGFKLKGE